MRRELVILIVVMFGLGVKTQAQTNDPNITDTIVLDTSTNDNLYFGTNCYEKLGVGIMKNIYSFSFSLGGISRFCSNIYTTFGLGFVVNDSCSNFEDFSYSSGALLANIDLGYSIGKEKVFVAPIVGLNLQLEISEISKTGAMFNTDFRLGIQLKLHNVMIYGVYNFPLNNNVNSFIDNTPYPEFGIGFIL